MCTELRTHPNTMVPLYFSIGLTVTCVYCTVLCVALHVQYFSLFILISFIGMSVSSLQHHCIYSVIMYCGVHVLYYIVHHSTISSKIHQLHKNLQLVVVNTVDHTLHVCASVMIGLDAAK